MIAIAIRVAIAIVIDFGREHALIFPMAESEKTQANHAIIPEGTQIVGRPIGIPLKELNFGNLSNGRKYDNHGKHNRSKSL
jgi:hypothetical protein